MKTNRISLTLIFIPLFTFFLSISCAQIQSQGSSSDQGSTSTGTTDNPQSNSSDLSLEEEVLSELNQARTNPKAYAIKVKGILKYYNGNRIERPGEVTIITTEGESAVKECIRYLENASSIQPLILSDGMSQAALDHVEDQSKSGTTGHVGSDGSSPFDRMNRYGNWSGTAGENIDYGNNIPERIVMSLIIDDGVPGRGHRENIFNPNFNVVGIAVGTHKSYNYMCVMTFAKAYKEKN